MLEVATEAEEQNLILKKHEEELQAVQKEIAECNAKISENERELERLQNCLLYTSDAADEEDSVDLGGPRIMKKKTKQTKPVKKPGTAILKKTRFVYK